MSGLGGWIVYNIWTATVYHVKPCDATPRPNDTTLLLTVKKSYTTHSLDQGSKEHLQQKRQIKVLA